MNKELEEIIKEIECYQNEDMCLIMLSQKENKALIDYITNLKEENERLTKNWNELEEWLIDLSKPKTNWQGDIERMYMLKIDYILDKMKEIQNGSDDNE